MPTTVFIALQCCQCSTMQVKQQKKSSNKWNCVVCNQKQSVRKVFAQGFMAKDVRKFVQSFNMSRQFAEQNPFSVDEQNETLEIEDQNPRNVKLKRTDWTEYINLEEESKTSDVDKNPGDELEPKIVTELPKAVFKKPKLKARPNVEDSTYGDESIFLREFGNRAKSKSQVGASSRYRGAAVRGQQEERSDYAAERKAIFAGSEEGMKHKQPIYGMPKQKFCLTDNDNVKFDDEKPRKNQSITADVGRSSKWNSYITEEDGGLFLGNGKDLTNQAYPGNDQSAFGTELIDQKVEEDVHPDFL